MRFSLKPPAVVSGLATLLLAYVIGMAALATLWPLDFRVQRLVVNAATSFEDVVLNVGLLLPAGFLWRLAHPVRRAPKCLDVLALGLLFSALLEGLQLFLPTRTSSPTDVVMNALGAWAGAGIYDGLKRKYRHAWLDRVCLALPLTKLLYLTVPLIGLQALCARRFALPELIPLAMFSATIASVLYERVAADGGGGSRRFSASFAAVFSVAASPLWARAPMQALLLTLLALAVASLGLAVTRRWPVRERRFELAAVRRALPWFAVYLVLAATHASPSGHRAPFGSAGGLLLLRDFAAFSVLGYMLSQLFSRTRADAWRRYVAVWIALGVAAFGALRLWQGVADLTELGLLLASGGLGGAIHRSELAVVRALRPSHSDPPNAPDRSSERSSKFPSTHLETS